LGGSINLKKSYGQKTKTHDLINAVSGWIKIRF